MHFFAVSVLSMAALPAVMFLWNLTYYRPARRSGEAPELSVSILIPARNEERSIESSLRAALATEDANIEVIVGDDQSVDGTAEIVTRIAAEDARVRLISLPGLPVGWCGKQFACQKLSESARYPILCFLDADVRLSPQGIASMVDTLETSRAALLSGFPRQDTRTWLEQLLIPLMHFLLLGFLPMIGMKRSTRPGYSAGCGQIFVADATIYRAAGGHAAIQNSWHDGIALPRAFRRAGFRTDLCDATAVATCRMYQNGREVVQGLLKNATEGLASPARIVPFSLLLVVGQVCPVILLAYLLLHGSTHTLLLVAIVSVLLSYLPRWLAAWKFNQPVLGVLLHPLSVLLLLGIQWYAFFLARMGEPSMWKGRRYSTP